MLLHLHTNPRKDDAWWPKEISAQVNYMTCFSYHKTVFLAKNTFVTGIRTVNDCLMSYLHFYNNEIT